MATKKTTGRKTARTVRRTARKTVRATRRTGRKVARTARRTGRKVARATRKTGRRVARAARKTARKPNANSIANDKSWIAAAALQNRPYQICMGPLTRRREFFGEGVQWISRNSISRRKAG